VHWIALASLENAKNGIFPKLAVNEGSFLLNKIDPESFELSFAKLSVIKVSIF
jgi:hypothetical protein